MTTQRDVGIIEKEVLRFEWKIPDFSTIVETEEIFSCFESPTFFSFNGFLRLYPRSELDSQYMRLFLKIKEQLEYPLAYNFSLKKSDGSEQQLVSGILERNNTNGDVGNLIKRSKILLRKSELAPQNAITIICILKREITHSTQPTASDLTLPMKLISK